MAAKPMVSRKASVCAAGPSRIIAASSNGPTKSAAAVWAISSETARKARLLGRRSAATRPAVQGAPADFSRRSRGPSSQRSIGR